MARRRTLFSVDFWEEECRRLRILSFPYSYCIKGLDGHEDKFVGGEVNTFSDIAELETHLYVQHTERLRGPLTMQIEGRKIDASRGTNDVEIPNWVEADGLQFLKCKARGIVLFEKYHPYESLKSSSIWNGNEWLLMCGCGIPRCIARRFLHRLSEQFKLPVYVMTDNDTWGYFFFSVLQRGILSPSRRNPFTAIPRSRYLGLRAGDFRGPDFKSMQSSLRKWKKPWDLRIAALQKYVCFQSQAWRDEFKAFQAQRNALDLNAVIASLKPEEFSDWILNRIVKRKWLA